MRRILIAGCTLLLLVNTGRGADDLVQERIKLFNDLADALEKKDGDKAQTLARQLTENSRKQEDAKKLAARQLAEAEERAQKALAASGLKLDLAALGLGLPGEAEIKEMIKLMNDLADGIEKKDTKKTEELQKKAEELGKKLKNLNLTKDEEKKLEDKYKADMEKAQKRLLEASLKGMN